MITEYEFHKKTDLDLSGLAKKVEALGYQVSMELAEEGVAVNLVSPDNSHMSARIKLYSSEDFYEYEVVSKNKATFMKLHDIFASL